MRVTLLCLKIKNLPLILLVDLTELVLETDHAACELFVNLVEVYNVLDVLFVQVFDLWEQVGKG